MHKKVKRNEIGRKIINFFRVSISLRFCTQVEIPQKTIWNACRSETLNFSYTQKIVFFFTHNIHHIWNAEFSFKRESETNRPHHHHLYL